MTFSTYDPAKPVRVRINSPLSYYPKRSIAIPGSRLIVCEDLIVSAVQVAPAEAHGFADEHFSELEFLALEEMRFFAAITLAVHPDDGMAYAYPLVGHVDVPCGLDDDALLEVARQHLARIPKDGWFSPLLPRAAGGPAYKVRESSVDVAQVLRVVRDTPLNDHLLMRGLGALLRAHMCWRHQEIAETAAIQLYIALDVSFEIVLEILRGRGLANPSALDAGALIDEVFNPGIESGRYFGDYYEDRIKTLHPSSRYGVFPVPPLQADDYYFLRHGLVEVYHWLITGRRLEPEPVLRRHESDPVP